MQRFCRIARRRARPANSALQADTAALHQACSAQVQPVNGACRLRAAFLRQRHGGLRMPGTAIWRAPLVAGAAGTRFDGMTLRDVARRARHPQRVITATDRSLGTRFEFIPDQFALMCSDLSSVPLSFAVAASSAVPLLLSPMTLQNCTRDLRSANASPLACTHHCVCLSATSYARVHVAKRGVARQASAC